VLVERWESKQIELCDGYRPWKVGRREVTQEVDRGLQSLQD
jgi:hypothetical protein